MKNRPFIYTLQNMNLGKFVPKSVLFSGLIFLFSVTLYSQVAWDGEAGTSNWGDALNWSGNSLPLPGDDVAVNTAITITGVPSILLNSLSVTENVILISDAGATLTINNVNATPALSIGISNSLTLGGGSALSSVNLVFQSVTGITAISGTLANTAFNSITINNGQSVNVTGSLTNVTDASILINGTLANYGTLLANAGSTSVTGMINNSGTVTGSAAN